MSPEPSPRFPKHSRKNVYKMFNASLHKFIDLNISKRFGQAGTGAAWTAEAQLFFAVAANVRMRKF